MLKKEIKKDLGLAEALAIVSIRMVFDGPGVDIIKEQCKDQDEIDRVMLSLALAHIAMATVAAKFNLTIAEPRKIRILDHLWETFTEKMSKQSQQFPVQKYIVESQELRLIKKRYDSNDFTTNMRKLLPIIFAPRLMEYEAALSEGLLHAKDEEKGKVNPFKKMVKAMVRHVYGDDRTVMDSPFVKLLSLFFASLQSMMSVCEGYT